MARLLDLAIYYIYILNLLKHTLMMILKELKQAVLLVLWLTKSSKNNTVKSNLNKIKDNKLKLEIFEYLMKKKKRIHLKEVKKSY